MTGDFFGVDFSSSELEEDDSCFLAFLFGFVVFFGAGFSSSELELGDSFFLAAIGFLVSGFLASVDFLGGCFSSSELDDEESFGFLVATGFLTGVFFGAGFSSSELDDDEDDDDDSCFLAIFFGVGGLTVFLGAGFSSSELDDEDSFAFLAATGFFTGVFFGTGFSSSELEEVSAFLETFFGVTGFFGTGLSSSELELEESFFLAAMGFLVSTFLAGVDFFGAGFSSSEDEEEEEDDDDELSGFFAAGFGVGFVFLTGAGLSFSELSELELDCFLAMTGFAIDLVVDFTGFLGSSSSLSELELLLLFGFFLVNFFVRSAGLVLEGGGITNSTKSLVNKDG